MLPTYAPFDPQQNQDAVVHMPAGNDTAPVSPNPSPVGRGDQAKGAAFPLSPVKKRSSFGVSRGTVLLTLNQLAVMSQNGIDIAEAIESVALGCRNKRLAQSLEQIHQCVNGGQPFSAAVANYGDHFPSTLAPMLAAAEATGNVPETLGNVCSRMRAELTMRGTVLGAMIYPAILIAASTIVMAALVLGVLPQFSKVFVSLGQPVPWSTQMLLDLGEFSRAHWMKILPLTIAAIAGLLSLRRNPFVQRPINRALMYAWPIRNAYRPLQAGRMFRLLATMVQGGVPLLQSVRLARNTTRDLYWRSLLDRIEDKLIDGSRASEAMFNVDFLPSESAQMMATAERTGRVAEVLENIGQYYEEEAGRSIKRLVVALEPAIILVMGVVVAGVVMSLLLPLLDVSSVR